MAKADKEYSNLLWNILENGVDKKDRTGTGTVSVFGRQVRFNMKDGFPLLTTKKMFTKGIIHELLWFLQGETNIQPLLKEKVNIWTGDAYKKYLNEIKYSSTGNWCHPELNDETGTHYPRPYTKEEFTDKVLNDTVFARKWGELGPIYGKQWVDWGGFEIISGDEIEGHNKGVNQIQKAIDTLINNPDSRRNMVSAWNVSEIDNMTLPPCHYGFQLYTRELSKTEREGLYLKWISDNPSRDVRFPHYDTAGIPKRAVSLMWNQRSVDTFLGLPFNIASYAMLLHMFAQQANMVPDELIGHLGDVHIYTNHIKQVNEQLSRGTDKVAPTFELEKADDMFSYRYENFNLSNYDSYPSIKGDLSN